MGGVRPLLVQKRRTENEGGGDESPNHGTRPRDRFQAGRGASLASALADERCAGA